MLSKARNLKRITLLSLIFAGGLAGTGTIEAKAQPSSTPYFSPTGAWQVQSTGLRDTRGLSDVQFPCVMSNKYDNGFLVRFSGGKDRLITMAVDFRQGIFNTGHKYEAAINVGQDYSQPVTGSAFSDSVLIFNLRSLEGLYQALDTGSYMGLSIGQNAMRFNIANISAGLRQLSSCSESGQVAVVAESAQADEAEEVYIRRQHKPARKSSASEVPASKALAASEREFQAPARRSKAVELEEQTVLDQEVWVAGRGEDVQTVIDRWSRKAGVNFDWQASGTDTVMHDIRHRGSFDEAVQRLLAQNRAASGLKGEMASSAGAPSRPIPITPAPATPMAKSQERSFMASGPSAVRWSAPRGSYLEGVLKAWSKRAGVELVWRTDRGFVLGQSVNYDSSYEEAVQEILSMFDKEVLRPVGQLNTDPVTGRRTLLIYADPLVSRSF